LLISDCRTGDQHARSQEKKRDQESDRHFHSASMANGAARDSEELWAEARAWDFSCLRASLDLQAIRHFKFIVHQQFKRFLRAMA
jgi:hypothetical protein